MKITILFIAILLFSFSARAARVGCWQLEEGTGNHATNIGSGTSCSLRIINEWFGNSNVVWTSATPNISGENYSVAATNLQNNHYWIQSYSSVNDGSDDPNDLDFVANDSFTLMVRAFWIDSDWNDGLIGKYSGWDNPGYFLAFRNSGGNGYLSLYLDDSTGGGDVTEVVYGPDSSLSGQWCYVAAVRDRSSGTNSCKIYINGELKLSVENDVLGSLANSDRFRLGTLFDSPAPQSMHGNISEAAVWNEALDSSKIAFYTNNTFNTDAQSNPIVTNYFLPNRLAIYYGYPSEVNGANGDLNAASNTFVKYDSVIFGAGLEEPGHGDHSNTETIIARLSNSGCEVFGYVDLGVSTDNHSYSTLTNKMSKWKSMGVAGIFLDDYGYDYLVSRVRQTNAVAYAHSIGCVVCANAWVPEDVFSDNYDATYNPDSLPSPLKSNDVYLLESYQYENGSYASTTDWTNKASKCFSYKTNSGARMFCVTTANNTSDYSEQKWWYAFDSAVLYNFDDVGWGEPSFSSSGNAANYLPWRTNHFLTIGNVFVTNANNNLPLNTAYTDEGKFWINSTAHTSAFQDTVSPRVSSNVITFPINNSDIVSGQTYQVTWNSNAITDMFLKSQPIKLSLVNSNFTNELISATANTGGWFWTVNSPISSNYRIELTAIDTTGNETSQYYAGDFTIRLIPEPFFSIFGIIFIFLLKRNYRSS